MMGAFIPFSRNVFSTSSKNLLTAGMSLPFSTAVSALRSTPRTADSSWPATVGSPVISSARAFTFFSCVGLRFAKRPDIAIESTPSETSLMASSISAFDSGAMDLPL